MTARHIKNFLFSVTLAGTALAASPVATISSSGSFVLRGATVQTAGVPTWPVMAGDEIKTTANSAIVEFRDGSKVVLGVNSSAKIDKTDSGLTFRLLSGDMKATPVSNSNVKILNSVSPEAPLGTAAGAKERAARTPPPPISTR